VNHLLGLKYKNILLPIPGVPEKNIDHSILFVEISASHPLITHENLSSGLLEARILGILYMVCQEKIYTI
jgi:hypothetical protein